MVLFHYNTIGERTLRNCPSKLVAPAYGVIGILYLVAILTIFTTSSVDSGYTTTLGRDSDTCTSIDMGQTQIAHPIFRTWVIVIDRKTVMVKIFRVRGDSIFGWKGLSEVIDSLLEVLWRSELRPLNGLWLYWSVCARLFCLGV